MNTNIERIILHVGLPKTGTSSLQHSLLQSKKRITQDDLSMLYPKVDHFHHGRLFLCMFSKDLSNKPSLVRRRLNNHVKLTKYVTKNKTIFEKQVNKSKLKNLIISGESISALSKDSLVSLRNYLFELTPCARLSIVVITREHTSLLASIYQQKIKTGSKIKFGKFMKRYSNRYRNRLSDVKDAFSQDEIIAYKFEDAIKHHEGPVGMFIEKVTGLKPPFDLINIYSNKGLSDKSVDILGYINKRVAFVKNNKLNDGRFVTDTKILKKLSGDKFKLEQEHIEKIKKLSSDDAVWLKTNFDIDYSNTPYAKPAQELIFDAKYTKELKKAFKSLSPVLKKLSFDYICDKIENSNKNYENTKVLNPLKDWMLCQDKGFAENDLNYYILAYKNLPVYRKLLIHTKQDRNIMRFTQYLNPVNTCNLVRKLIKNK